MTGKVKCTCGWSWNKSDSSKKDMYICHECGRDNSNNMKNGGWLDNYGEQENYNDFKVSAPEGFVGEGYSNVGRNYSPAWGGQFQKGGKLEKQTEGDRALKTAGKVAEAAYISSWLDKLPGAETAYDVYNFGDSLIEGDFIGMGSNLVGALLPGVSGKVIESVAQEYLPKTPQVEKDKFKFNLKSSPSDRQRYLKQYGPGYLNHPGFIKHELYKKQNGGSLPGATGMMYARIGAPSNGKYAKKTKASAQDGKKVKYGTPEYEEAYNKGEVITKEGVRSPILLDEVVVKGKKKDKNWLEQYADKIVDENKDAGVLGAILGTPVSAITSLPQLMGMKAITGEMNRPSEAMNIKNPYGAMTVDAIADPANLIGVGELSGLSKLTKEEALSKLANVKNIRTSIHPELRQGLRTNGLSFESKIKPAFPEGYNLTPDESGSRYWLNNNNKQIGQVEYMSPKTDTQGRNWGSINIEIDPRYRGKGLSAPMYQQMLDHAEQQGHYGIMSIDGSLQSPTQSKAIRKYFNGKYSEDSNLLKHINETIDADNMYTKEDNLLWGENEPMKPYESNVYLMSNKNKFKQGGVIKDDMGQWAHPGEITEIDSPYITMKGVDYPVLGISDEGDVQMMYPDEDYEFIGNKVTEYPMARNGINNLDAKPLQKLDQLTNFTNYNTKQPGGWLDNL
jgi:predicted GNAT family acetyltransferase